MSKELMRSEVLDGAPLHYAPENEHGVVFLFAHLAKKWRLRIDAVRRDFPDCIAYQKIQGKEKEVRIEFEYKSKNFKNHKHDPSKCDCIVCWEHNWPDAPEHLKIIELRKEYGLGFNVWIKPLNAIDKQDGTNWGKILSSPRFNSNEAWTVPGQAHKNDLILFYLKSPDKCIKHIFVLKERAYKEAGQPDCTAQIKRVCELKAPLHFEDMKRNKFLETAGFMRARIQGKPNVIEYWPHIYDLIIHRNPSLINSLKKYAPGNI